MSFTDSNIFQLITLEFHCAFISCAFLTTLGLTATSRNLRETSDSLCQALRLSRSDSVHERFVSAVKEPDL